MVEASPMASTTGSSSPSQPITPEWKWIYGAQEVSKGESPMPMGTAVGAVASTDASTDVAGGKAQSQPHDRTSMTMSLNSALEAIDEREDKKVPDEWEDNVSAARRQRKKLTMSVNSTGSSISGTGDQSRRISTRSLLRSFSQRKPTGKPEDRIAALDDEEGHAEFFLALLYESLDDSKLFVAGSIGVLIVWSVCCAVFSEWLRGLALDNPGGRAERWMEDIENCKSAISILGTLFVFTLVFRFNTCYDRWWDSRMNWGDIVSRCLDLNMMNRRWIVDQDLGDRLSRHIVAYSYACKALLRGTSLAEEEEDGKALVQRGVLTQEELDYMHNYPCWQPHYCLEMIRAIIVEAHKVPGGKGIVCDEQHKLHGQFFRCFDGIIKQMTDLIGDAVRTRSSGLPASYDAITMLSFFMFFILAAFVWSIGIGWMTPIIIGCASLIVLLLIVMGSKLVDPFGYDKVDIPMEAFCATIEAQIHAMDERSRSGIIEKFSRTSKPRASMMKSATFKIPKLN